MKPIKVTDIEWANAKHSAIDCNVIWDTMPKEIMPFTASPDDNHEHGRNLFDAIRNGEYGEIAPYNTERDKPKSKQVGFTYKADVWERATDEEVELLDSMLNEIPKRLSRMWNDCQFIEHDSKFYNNLYEVMEVRFGGERTRELLSESGSRLKKITSD